MDDLGRWVKLPPFQDGNGRVARALASIDFIKAGLFPVLVRRTDRDRYIDALRAADAGQLRALVGYFADIQQTMIQRAIHECTQSPKSMNSCTDERLKASL